MSLDGGGILEQAQCGLLFLLPDFFKKISVIPGRALEISFFYSYDGVGPFFLKKKIPVIPQVRT